MICLNNHDVKIFYVKTHPMHEYRLTFSKNTLKVGILHFIIIVMASAKIQYAGEHNI